VLRDALRGLINHKGEAEDVRKANTLQTDRGETGVKESFAVRYSAAAEIDFVL